MFLELTLEVQQIGRSTLGILGASYYPPYVSAFVAQGPHCDCNSQSSWPLPLRDCCPATRPPLHRLARAEAQRRPAPVQSGPGA